MVGEREKYIVRERGERDCGREEVGWKFVMMKALEIAMALY